MKPTEAIESYKNGNLSEFRDWLGKATKTQIATVTALWLQEHTHELIALKGYIKQAEEEILRRDLK